VTSSTARALLAAGLLAVVLPGCEKPVHYADCDAVRAAGKAPLHQGEPGV
jgi:hypothetical protein